jgi:hypothetical protein
MNSSFEKIKSGLEDAVAFAKGDESKAEAAIICPPVPKGERLSRVLTVRITESEMRILEHLAKDSKRGDVIRRLIRDASVV